MRGTAAYWQAVGVATVAASLLVWASGGIGLVGSDEDVLYGGVLAVGLAGAFVARFHPRGMARTMFATALAQAAVAAGALAAGAGSPQSAPLVVVALNGGFGGLWVGAAVLFRQAAHERPRASVGAPRPPIEPAPPRHPLVTDVPP